MIKYHCVLIVFIISNWKLISDDVFRNGIENFISINCIECHDEDVSKGDFNIDDLSYDLNNESSLVRWIEVFDRVELNEMPPKKKKRPDESQRKKFLKILEEKIHSTSIANVDREGRTQLRRLTAREYEFSVQDLLGIGLPLQELLTEESFKHGFDTVASSQQFSHFSLKNIINAADLAVGYAFDRALKKEVNYEREFTRVELTTEYNDRSDVFYRGPQNMGERIIAWPSRTAYFGRLEVTAVPESGWYEIIVKDVHSVNHNVVWGTLRSGFCFFNAPKLHMISLIEATPEKKDYKFLAYMHKGHMLELRPNDKTLKRCKQGRGGRANYEGTDNLGNGIHGISYTGLKMKRVYPKANSRQVEKRLLGDLSYQDFEEAHCTPLFDNYLKKTIKRFAEKAFRRPISKEDLQSYVSLASKVQKENPNDLLYPLKVVYSAILCSPNFLNFIEKPKGFDDYNIASRLSYALWSSVPDHTLLKAAQEQKLSNEKALSAQVERMMRDPKFDRFLLNFTNQYLDLKDMNSTAPKEDLFYTYDSVVHQSLIEETQLFFKELVDKDLGLQNFIKSDFVYMNERLARHYNLKNTGLKIGNGLQKVSAKIAGRSGLVSQGSILKVTADGISTSPIIRGLWVSEKILGVHVPEPPSTVPEIDPDIRGAISIRDQLEKHRQDSACASCHQKFDPHGLVLENFNPVGVWRDSYTYNEKTMPIDASVEIEENAASFNNYHDWQDYYVNQPELLTKAFVKQLITYMTGAELVFSDRKEVDKIVEKAKEHNYGIRSIIKTVLTSPIFMRK